MEKSLITLLPSENAALVGTRMILNSMMHLVFLERFSRTALVLTRSPLMRSKTFARQIRLVAIYLHPVSAMPRPIKAVVGAVLTFVTLAVFFLKPEYETTGASKAVAVMVPRQLDTMWPSTIFCRILQPLPLVLETGLRMRGFPATSFRTRLMEMMVRVVVSMSRNQAYPGPTSTVMAVIGTRLTIAAAPTPNLHRLTA